MPKRKRHDRLPSGWGSIRYIGSGRRLPYAVHPPSKKDITTGKFTRQPAICYVPDWYTGFAVLSAYHAGTYTPGMELAISREVEQSSVDLDAFCRRVLKDRGMVMQSAGTTFKEAYDQFIEWKFGEHAPRKLSESAKNGYKLGWNYLSVCGNEPLDSLAVDRLQAIVNDCEKQSMTRSRIVQTAKQVYRYALAHEMCEKNPAQHLFVPDERKGKHGVAFSDEELKILWKNKNDDAVAATLIMCYSGFRISAVPQLEINLDELYFKGGIKTAAGKNRIVPIHSAIVSLVERLGDPIIKKSTKTFQNQFRGNMEKIGIKNHTVHDCRHTFSRLCESYGVREADRKRMMGHSFGSDITNGIYGHRTLEELRCEIEKIQVSDK